MSAPDYKAIAEAIASVIIITQRATGIEPEHVMMPMANVRALAQLFTLRPADEWHEDHGPALWWYFKDGQLQEAPYVGTPLDCPSELALAVEAWTTGHEAEGRMVMQLPLKTGGWPGYHTHWTPLFGLPVPRE